MFGSATALIRDISTPRRFLLMGTTFGLPLVTLIVLLAASPAAVDLSVPLGIIAGGTLFGLYLVLCWHRQSHAGFQGMERAIQRLAAGDLRAEHAEHVNTSLIWSLAYQLDDAAGSLGHAVGQVRASAEEIDRESHTLSTGYTSLAQRSEEQAATLEETASGMEELAGTVRQNATSCERADELARAADDVATRGADTINRAVERMAMIEKSSRRIVDIVGVIESIAFQTNILALNAAVEAARAGEQGKGFAVVASEVRGLAYRSSESAREIKALIKDSASNVAEGGKLVGEAGAIINGIVDGVREVKELIGEVARASKEQSHGVEEINRAIAQMESVTRQNAALVEQASRTTHAFEAAAGRLIEAVGRFKSLAYTAAPAPSPAPLAALAAHPVPRTDRTPRPTHGAPNAPTVTTLHGDDEWEAF